MIHSQFLFSSFSNNLGAKVFIPIIPKGAVNNIARTAIARIIEPESTPAASGTPPIAACAVALGIYATAQNSLSLNSNLSHLKKL